MRRVIYCKIAQSTQPVTYTYWYQLIRWLENKSCDYQTKTFSSMTSHPMYSRATLCKTISNQSKCAYPLLWCRSVATITMKSIWKISGSLTSHSASWPYPLCSRTQWSTHYRSRTITHQTSALLWYFVMRTGHLIYLICMNESWLGTTRWAYQTAKSKSCLSRFACWWTIYWPSRDG